MKKWKSINKSDADNSSKSSHTNTQNSKVKCVYTPVKINKNDTDLSMSEVVQRMSKNKEKSKINMDSRIQTQLIEDLKLQQLSTQQFQNKYNHHHRQSTDRILRQNFQRTSTRNLLTSRSRKSEEWNQKKSIIYQEQEESPVQKQIYSRSTENELKIRNVKQKIMRLHSMIKCLNGQYVKMQQTNNRELLQCKQSFVQDKVQVLQTMKTIEDKYNQQKQQYQQTIKECKDRQVRQKQREVYKQSQLKQQKEQQSIDRVEVEQGKSMIQKFICQVQESQLNGDIATQYEKYIQQIQELQVQKQVFVQRLSYL